MTDMSLGYMAMDRVTGFKGTITAYCVYLSGEHQVELTPISGGGDSRWFNLLSLAISGVQMRHDIINHKTGESTMRDLSKGEHNETS